MVDFLELISFTFSQFNVSHKINSLHFGHQYYGIKSPLDGASRVVSDTHGQYPFLDSTIFFLYFIYYVHTSAL